MRGMISPNLGNISTLEEVDLSDNQLRGPIPNELSNLTQLTSLNLSKNLFNDSLDFVCDLINLTTLHLASNLFTDIPNCISTLPIIDIDIGANQLPQGNIPSWIYNLTSLISLQMGYLSLNGNISQNLSKLTKLNYFNAPGNQLSGSLEVFLRLDNLQTLGLQSNSFTEIPNDIYILPLKSLDLGANLLTSFPPTMSNLNQLTFLNLGKNNISSLPDLSNLTQLEYLFLDQNQLTSVPTWLSNLPSLYGLYMNKNHLTGGVPPLSNTLQYIDFSNNTLDPALWMISVRTSMR